MPEKSESEILEASCNKCLGRTKHRLIGRHGAVFDLPGYEEDDTLYESIYYEMLLCCGCESVTFRKISTTTDPEEFDEDGPIENKTEEYYPPPMSRRQPVWLSELFRKPSSRDLYSLMTEVYAAVNADLHIIASIGVRTIIEKAMTTKVGDRGSFRKTLTEFQERGYIATKETKFLERTIDAGSASAHRAYRPSRGDLSILVDIAENLIERVFIYPEKLDAVARKIPRRRKRLTKRL